MQINSVNTVYYSKYFLISVYSAVVYMAQYSKEISHMGLQKTPIGEKATIF